MALSPLNQRRWRNFKANRRAKWSLIVMGILYGLSLFAELLANDHPLLVRYRGEWYAPFLSFYSEQTFGGDLRTEAGYRLPEVQCLIYAAGAQECWDDPEGVLAEARSSGTVLGQPVDKGFMLWAPIPYSYQTIVDTGGVAPGPISAKNWLGTDDASRDVLTRVIYGFRLSITFALIVTVFSTLLGVTAGAIQGYFGGAIDLVFQRTIEIWSSVPSLYVIIILSAVFTRSVGLMIVLMVLFGWTGLVGVVRAEFLRARNFEYVRAAKALGLGDMSIMFRHVLPNAMVATLTFMPFIIIGTISGLAGLDYLGFGLPATAPSLGQLARQAHGNLQMPSLAFVAFFTYATMLTLIVFIFEGIRDAFDPRKTFG